MSPHHDHHRQQEQGSEEGCGHHQATPIPQSWLVAIAGLLTGTGLLLSWRLGEDASLSTMAYALASLAGGVLVFPPALKSLRRVRLDMNVLMMVAVAGAWLIGEGAEAAAVIFLFSLSELLESWSVGRARRAISTLLKLAPETAQRLSSDGTAQQVPVASIIIGDLLLVKNGERVPVDGEVVSGASAINQAPITGESLPVEKSQGDPVYAGTINGEGSLTVRATKSTGQSLLSRITRLVEEAEKQKAPTERFVDRFAAIYTPVVFVLALLVAILPPLWMGSGWSQWTYRALVLLVIACPCALVIATPVSIVSGLTALARCGVLVKGGGYLEAVGKLRVLAVDKTGTITEGRPRVTGIESTSALPEEEILARAAAVDFHSMHPLAQAVVEAARQRSIPFTPAQSFRSRTGLGAQGDVDGHPHFVGNHRFTHELGVCTPELEERLRGIEASGKSLAVVGHMPHEGCQGEALGIIAISDTVRPEAVEAMRQLHASGVEKIVMLSGDNQLTADAIAQMTGIDEVHGDLLPEQKVAHMKRLLAEYKHVGMMGDGVNDAPALALASVGIAMGAAGSDTAIETADIALMQDDLTKVAEAVHLGRRTVRIIQFNVTFAIAVKAAFLGLAVTGHTSLWLAILADTGATLLVILNALRLLGTKARG